MESEEIEVRFDVRERPAKKKDLLAFWIFGLCNNYGYVVMLTAAIDILNTDTKLLQFNFYGRDCTHMSTGAVLLADIIPSFVIKTCSPFLPYNTNWRVFVSCIISICGFISVATASSRLVVILGVILTSFASGLGEPTFLAHSTNYNKNVISTWSSGTGGAGVIGALSYSLMREFGLSSQQTLLLMIFVPTLEFFTYFFILTHPETPDRQQEAHPLIGTSESSDDDGLNTLAQKLAYIPELMIFFIPLVLVYFFEYFINQGLFELVTFHDSSISPSQQYRWYQVTYQIGVFVSRSSVNIVQIKRTWIMAVIQGLIAIYFLTEAIYLFTPSIVVIFVVIFVEGLQGGLTYVNTYYQMSLDIPPSHRKFAMNIVASSDSIGIILAGFLAIPTHNWICQMPGISNI